jgi:quercetin dioxygenase-like cupin family protein
MDDPQGLLLPPGAGSAVALGGLGVVFKLVGEDTGGRFALVEHPLAPKTLAAPVHTHSREDEYSYVLDGTVVVQLGDRRLEAAAGAVVGKPRGIPHTFWNPTDTPARVLEVISPAGAERYFQEVAGLIPAQGPPDFAAMDRVADRYGLRMDRTSTPRLLQAHSLRI